MADNFSNVRGAKLRVALSLCLLLAGALGAGLWWLFQPPLPPEVSVEGLDQDVAAAIAEARAATIAQPHADENRGTLGRVLLANEVYPEIALVCFQQAERLNVQNPRWPYFSAGLLLGKNQRNEALVKLERAVALTVEAGERHRTPRLLLAETLAALGRTDDAAYQFDEVLIKEPANPRAHFGLGMLANAREDWPKCRTHLEACLGSPQSRKRACAQLATVCERLQDRKNADHYAALAARLPKDFDWSDPLVLEYKELVKRKRDRYRTVEQLEAAGQLKDAADRLARLVVEYPDDDVPHLMAGRVLAQMGQFERAETHLRRALQLAPDKIQLHYLLSLTLFRHGEALAQAKDGDRQRAMAMIEESIQASRQVLQRRPDYGYAHMALGLALKHLGRKEDALAAFRQAVHCNPEYADNHLFLGTALAEQGLLPEARPYLDQALLLADPNDPRPKEARAKFFPREAP